MMPISESAFKKAAEELNCEVAAVKAAVDAVKGNPPCEIIAAAVISAPSEETSRLVKEEEEKHHK